MKKLKVIFHIDESEKWSLLLGNVKNLLNDLGQDSINVIVLANSVAVREYVPSEENEKLLTTVSELSKRGVLFKACRNALAGHKIDEALLADPVQVVPAGVTELVQRQAEAYGYIKP